jgi:hypothetical protein
MRNKRVIVAQCVLLIILLIMAISYYLINPSKDAKSSFLKNELILDFDSVEFEKIIPFFKRLDQDNFSLESSNTSQKISIQDCKSKQVYQFNGSGLKSFKFKSKTPINGDYYPSFTINILTFSSVSEANKYEKVIQDSFLYSSTIVECNELKTPTKVISNGHFVFYFTNSSEMSKPYTDKYAKVLKELPM